MNHAVRPESKNRPIEGGRGRAVDRIGVHSVNKNLCFNSRGIAKFWLRWQLSVAYSRHAHAFAGAQICHSLHFFWPRHFASGLLSEKLFPGRKLFYFYTNTCISTTIVACYNIGVVELEVKRCHVG